MNAAADKKEKSFDLIVNRQRKDWPNPTINGTDVKNLAGSPADWVVNLRTPGPGDDPEIANDQEVELDHQAEPKGIKQFTTRKPKTAPGA